VKCRGGIVVVIAHRPSALAAVDMVAVVQNGKMTAFGPKEDVLGAVIQATPPAPAAASASHMRMERAGLAARVLT
jgi:ATP-binding cassette subfamily C protein